MPKPSTNVSSSPHVSKNWLVVVSVIFRTTPTTLAIVQARMPPGFHAGMRPGRNSECSALRDDLRRYTTCASATATHATITMPW